MARAAPALRAAARDRAGAASPEAPADGRAGRAEGRAAAGGRDAGRRRRAAEPAPPPARPRSRTPCDKSLRRLRFRRMVIDLTDKRKTDRLKAGAIAFLFEAALGYALI